MSADAARVPLVVRGVGDGLDGLGAAADRAGPSALATLSGLARCDLVFHPDDGDGAGPRRLEAGTASVEGGVREIDGRGLVALAGFVDLHTRLREPGPARRGTLASECVAALGAGFATVACAPDTEPAIDSRATVELVLRRAAAAGGARVLPVAALTAGLDGERLAELATLGDAGCVAAGQADRPVADARLLADAMRYAASFGMPLFMTPRDARLGIDGCAHAGPTALALGLTGVPVAAETIALATLLELARESGARLHVSRLSSARALELVARAKGDGMPVTCDVGIHHLHFTDEDLDGFDARYASAVPFRSAEDREALREGVASGLVDAIASDHAPLDADASLAPFARAEPGLSAYDRFLPLALGLAGAGVPLARVVEALTRGPARALPVGAVGPSTVLIDPAGDPDALPWRSAGANSPFAGPGSERRAGTGTVRLVIAGGRALGPFAATDPEDPR